MAETAGLPLINVEIKAHCSDPEPIRKYLQDNGASFKGVDHQVDTYFRVPQGRLKLREGWIENNLIYYRRPDQAGPKTCEYILHPVDKDSHLKTLLTEAIEILIVVDKVREIYYINNVKFHIDQVNGLGSFMEIEATCHDGTLTRDQLLVQCRYYQSQLNIPENELITVSYSDLLLSPASP